MRTNHGYGNLFNIYKMPLWKLKLLERYVDILLFMQDTFPTRRAHWVGVRIPRHERHLISAVLALLVVASQYSMQLVVVVGSGLSFGVILWSLLRLARTYR